MQLLSRISRTFGQFEKVLNFVAGMVGGALSGDNVLQKIHS